jgi:hypothetical protein
LIDGVLGKWALKERPRLAALLLLEIVAFR